MALYADTFGGLGAADIAQQDAATRNQAQQLQFLVNLANQRNLAEQTASRERLGNRGYQSEDYRTTTQGDTARYGTDAQAEAARNLHILNTVIAQNAANRGEAADQVAFLMAAEAARHNQAGEQNTAETTAAQERVSNNSLKAAEAAAKVAAIEKAQHDAMQFGGPMGQLKMLQDQQEAAKEQQAADALNASVDQVHHYFWTPGEQSDAAKKIALQKLINDQGLGDRFAIIDGANGTPRAVSRKLLGISAPASAVAPAGPAAVPITAPATTTSTSNPAANAFLRLIGMNPQGPRTASPTVAAPAGPTLQQDQDGNFIFWGKDGRPYGTKSKLDALTYLRSGNYLLTPPTASPSAQDIPQNQ